MRYAASEGRCFVARDSKDPLRLTHEWLESGEHHAGLLLVPASFRDRDISGMADALASIASLHPDGMAPYQVQYLPRVRAG